MIVHVEDCGPIKEAVIDLKPLTIFLGPNTTGKSFLAKVIYALRQNWVLDIENFETEFKLFYNTVENMFSKSRVERKNCHIETELLIDLLNRVLEDFDRNNLTTIFRNPISSNSISIEFMEKYFIQLEPDIDSDADPINVNLKVRLPNEFNIELTLDSMRTFSIEHLSRFVLEPLISRNVFFIPAERIGFLFHTKIMKIATYEKNLISELDEPRKEFFRQLDLSKDQKIQNEFFKGKIANKIASITKTKLIPFRKDTLEFFFSDYRDNIAYSVKDTSSLNASIAPLINLLQYGDINREHKYIPDQKRRSLIIYEEPEAHLHPEAQKGMAELCAMLINQGIEMLIITHSPYFVDQLNNLIYANEIVKKHPQSKEEICKVIDEDALLDIDMVSAYHFDEDKESKKFVTHDAIDDGTIMWDTFSDVSNELDRINSKLVDIEYNVDNSTNDEED